MDNSKYYNLTQLLSYNAYFNIVMSGRGTGKTYSAIDLAVNKFIKKGKQTCYVRRTVQELDNCKEQLFDDIKKKYPKLKFKIDGDFGYINDKKAIILKALSTASNNKSTPYPDCDMILFEEYIPTKSTHTGKFLKNEMILIFDLIETIFRDRELNGELQRVLFLSNAVSYVCPLFSYFNIIPEPNKRFQKFKEGLIVLEIFTSEKFIEEKNKTSLAKLIKGTAYYDYAIGNQTLEDTNEFIKDKPKGKYTFVAELKIENRKLGIWFNYLEGIMYIDEKLDNTSNAKFCIYTEDLQEGYSLIKDYRKTWRVKEIRNAFNNSRVFYSTQEIKKLFMDRIIKYI